MATVGEAIAASIIAQWNVGTGGTKPDPIKYVVEDAERTPNVKVADAVFVWLPLRRVFDNDIDVAEKFRNVTYTVRIECHTKTSSARQLEIENEVDRILASGTVITGATKQRVLEINDVSNRSYSVGAKFVSEILMEVFTAMEESATAYGTATTTTLTTDELVVNHGTHLGGAIGGTAVKDEDDMASDDATAIATQQSIKAYTDKANLIGVANAEWVPCSFKGGTFFKYVSSNSYITNLDANNMALLYSLTALPATRGGLKLYVAGSRIGIGDADVNNYVDNVFTFGISGTARTQLDLAPTNLTTADVHEDTFTAVDASSYEQVDFVLTCVNDGAAKLDIYSALMKCYYDT